jgi:LmbE family N-acetylglucosaminyl deacetylase
MPVGSRILRFENPETIVFACGGAIGVVACAAMDRPERIVGVFAHPDDEVFCAGGTIAKWCAEGSQAIVISATRGEAGQIRDSGIATRRTLGAVREGELHEACRHLGAGRTIVLDHADGRLADVPIEQLADEVEALLAELAPDVVISFGEDGAYGHPDHVATGNATATAVERLRKARSNGPTLLRSHFPMRQMSLAERLADWLVTMDGRFDGTHAYGRSLTLFAEESTTMRFASDDVRIEWFPSGSLIVEEGEPATSLCLILSGTVDVFEDRNGTPEFMRQLGEGQYFGELGITRKQPRSASVVAAGNVTCLVLSPSKRTKYQGRGDGANARLASSTDALDLLDADDGLDGEQNLVTIDVSDYVDVKVAALAAHRSQYPIERDAFPRSMLVEMYGHEHFRAVG